MSFLTNIFRYVTKRVVAYIVIGLLIASVSMFKDANAAGLVTAFQGDTQLCSNPVILGEIDAAAACMAIVPPDRAFCGVEAHPNNPNARRCPYAGANASCDDGVDQAPSIVASSTQCNDDCEADTGRPGSHPSNANQFQCDGTCEVEVTGSTLVIYGTGLSGQSTTGATATTTGNGCDLGPDNAFDGSNGACVSMGSDTVCITDPSEQNCGTVNGEDVCVSTPEPNSCYSTGSGGAICSENVGAPPGPDDGTPGAPATPDGTLVDPQGTTINYYSSTTVNNSSAGISSSGSNPGSGGSGGGGDGSGGDGTIPGEDGICDPATDDCSDSCDPIIESCGTGVQGGVSCDSPPTVTGGPLFRSIIFQEWKSRCEEMPTESELIEMVGSDFVSDLDTDVLMEDQALDDVLDTSGFGWSRACPADVSLDLGSFGSVSIPMSPFCSLAAIIGVLVLGSAGVFGLRFIFR